MESMRRRGFDPSAFIDVDLPDLLVLGADEGDASPVWRPGGPVEPTLATAGRSHEPVVDQFAYTGAVCVHHEDSADVVIEDDACPIGRPVGVAASSQMTHAGPVTVHHRRSSPAGAIEGDLRTIRRPGRAVAWARRLIPDSSAR